MAVLRSPRHDLHGGGCRPRVDVEPSPSTPVNGARLTLTSRSAWRVLTVKRHRTVAKSRVETHRWGRPARIPVARDGGSPELRVAQLLPQV